MFICSDCLNKKPELAKLRPSATSQGQCEVCHKIKKCKDVFTHG